MYLLDTNTLIYFFKGQGQVAKNLLGTPPTDIAISAIVLYELEYGITRSKSPKKRRQQLWEFCSNVKILQFAQKEAECSANIRAQLDKQGTPIGPYDIIIAGTALAQNKVLVTNNTKEFSRVPKLKLANWF